MEERKWEDLEMDCLVNVLGRVDMASLLLHVPFVCKSWHRASLNPLCWRRLVFSNFATDPWDLDPIIGGFMHLYGISRLSETAFIKFIIDRSSRNATMLALPNDCTEKAFKYAVDECPAVKILGLPPFHLIKQSLIIQLIGKWKDLECLNLGCSINLREILAQISLNCKNFSHLIHSGARIKKEEATAIVTLLPKIKHMCLRRADIDRENLITILQGCKELVYLDVSDSVGFEVDEKISELASHITTFYYKGARLFDDDDFDWAIDHDEIYDGYYSG